MQHEKESATALCNVQEGIKVTMLYNTNLFQRKPIVEVILPGRTYGAETCILSNKMERKLFIVQGSMQRSMVNLTNNDNWRMDKVRTERKVLDSNININEGMGKARCTYEVGYMGKASNRMDRRPKIKIEG